MNSKHKRSFFQQVYKIVQTIPDGKVTTYGQIAQALHTQDARRVGHALHANPDGEKTPCHRVVFANGGLAPGYAFGGPNEQLWRLQLEGVPFTPAGKVDIAKALYNPTKA